ncbi:MAG: hypothetical protein JWN13_5157, partial [Betaproteobacteria bacterium]|nr:hypothetical protein [Betaproteobacteria bacterium]
VFWSIGVVSLQGMGTSFDAHQYG